MPLGTGDDCQTVWHVTCVRPEGAGGSPDYLVSGPSFCRRLEYSTMSGLPQVRHPYGGHSAGAAPPHLLHPVPVVIGRVTGQLSQLGVFVDKGRPIQVYNVPL